MPLTGWGSALWKRTWAHWCKEAKQEPAWKETDEESSEKSLGDTDRFLHLRVEGQEDDNENTEGRLLTDRGKNVPPWRQPSNEADFPVKFCRLHLSKFQEGSPEQHGPWEELFWTVFGLGLILQFSLLVWDSQYSLMFVQGSQKCNFWLHTVVKAYSKNLQRNLFLCKRRQFQPGI